MSNTNQSVPAPQTTASGEDRLWIPAITLSDPHIVSPTSSCPANFTSQPFAHHRPADPPHRPSPSAISKLKMQIRTQLALVLVGLLSAGTHARPCDESSTPAPTATASYPGSTYSGTGHGHHTSVVTETVTTSITVGRTGTATATLSVASATTAIYTPVTTQSSTHAPTASYPSSTHASTASSVSSSAGGGSSVANSTPTAGAGGSSGGQCNTGPVQCCDSVQDSGSPAASSALKGVNAPIGAGVPVGLNCTPLNVLGLGSSANW